MNLMDLKISEKVAEEASKQMNELKQLITKNKDVNISILTDTIKDNKEQILILKRVIGFLSLIIFITTIAITSLEIRNKKTLDELYKIFECSNVESTEIVYKGKIKKETT